MTKSELTGKTVQLTLAENGTIKIAIQKHWTEYIRSVFVFILISIFVFGLLLNLISNKNNINSKENNNLVYYDTFFQKTYPETENSKEFSQKKKIALVTLEGKIMSNASYINSPLDNSAIITPKKVREQFNYIRKRDDIAGVLLYISSPGGMVSASDEIAYLVNELNKDIPVFVYSADILASGGYYIAVNAKKIYTHKYAQIGSIGVIYQIPNIEKLVKDKLGIELEIYKGGEHKDMLSPMRKRSLKEKEILKQVISDMHEDFKGLVAKKRKLNKEEIESLATGEVWSGEIALSRKLVDKNLYLEEVAETLQKELKLSEQVIFVKFEKQKTLFDRFIPTSGLVSMDWQNQVIQKFSQVLPVLQKGYYFLYTGI